MQRPTKFQIKGLFGNRDVTLPIDTDALILVGPNGIGKSSVINIFYFFVSRQWSRLVEYEFSEITFWFEKEEVKATHSELTRLSQIEKNISESIERLLPSMGSRISRNLDILQSKGLLKKLFLKSSRYEDLKKISEQSNISGADLKIIKRVLSHHPFQDDSDDSSSNKGWNSDIELKIIKNLPGRTIYLPTFRRIEKDLKEILPDFEDRLRSSSRFASPVSFFRSREHYIDLVSFGMEDVRSNIENKTRHLRDYSLKKFNNLSGIYLKDVINGQADQYNQDDILNLNENQLDSILERVNEQVLTQADKKLLRDKIIGMKSKNKTEMAENDRYLAHYFTILMSVNADISKQELDIKKFIEVCNSYLSPEKKINYDDTTFNISIIDSRKKPIDLSMLSSGEKQVVSLFSHLYLNNSDNQIVIIDEPELSLSVDWQERFLVDIIDSNHCKFIVSVTHSPFIYNNKLKDSAVDLNRMIEGS